MLTPQIMLDYNAKRQILAQTEAVNYRHYSLETTKSREIERIQTKFFDARSRNINPIRCCETARQWIIYTYEKPCLGYLAQVIMRKMAMMLMARTLMIEI